jgi:hypothetical protein
MSEALQQLRLAMGRKVIIPHAFTFSIHTHKGIIKGGA